MVQSKYIFAAWLALGVLSTGCLGPRRSDYRSSHTLDLQSSSDRADHLWNTALETLRALHLELDRVDRRAGVITTFPEVSQHFFELWRHDVDTAPDFWEATLNADRRWVELQFDQEQGRWRALHVVVHKQRFSAPDRQFNSTGAAYQYFGFSLPSTTGQEQISAEDERWVDRGRDPAMEEYILRAILDRTGSSTAP